MSSHRTRLIRHAIFDLDGVLVDTAKYHYLGWKRLADELGIRFTENDNERLKGISRMASLQILLDIGGMHISDEEKSKLAEQKNRYYMESIQTLESSETLPGAKDFLLDLRRRGVCIALGSASKNASTIIDRLALANLFDAVVDGNSTENSKPAPDMFLIAAKRLGALPEDCVVFEDAESGIEAAHRAGMIAIGVGMSDRLGAADSRIDGFLDPRTETLKANLFGDKGGQER